MIISNLNPPHFYLNLLARLPQNPLPHLFPLTHLLPSPKMATKATAAPPATDAKSMEKRKPVFVKIDQLKPGTKNYTLTVNVASSNTVLRKGKSPALNSRPTRIAECLIGDDTGCIVFTARNEQTFAVDMMKPGATVILRNAKIDMFKGSMRLAVDKWGCVEVTNPVDFTVKEDNNLSLIEYELVSVAEE